MEFRRITGLPPYVFTIIDGLKVEARRAGMDVIDLGFGNPDIPSPALAVDKLCEAAHNTRNHRYSASRGIPKLRQALADLYQRRFGVYLDPEREVITTIGAKEGFSHLMWVLLGPGDAALVPSPSYPIHIFAPLFAGASAREIPMSTDGNFIERMREAYEYSWPKPRVIVLSFPHNPTTATVDLDFFQQVVDFAREHEVIVVHDNAYAELGYDGFEPPSILQAEGAKECAVELYSMTKSFSMAGWRLAFLAGNADVVQALAKLKSYLDYGTFQPIQIAATVDHERGRRLPSRGPGRVPGPARRAHRRPPPDGVGRAPAPGDDVRLGADPRALPGDGLRRVRLHAGARCPGRPLARDRLRSGRGGLRAVRPHRERAAHPAGAAHPEAQPHQAGVSVSVRAGRWGAVSPAGPAAPRR